MRDRHPSGVMSNRQYTNEQLLKAIDECQGQKYRAADKVGCAVSTIRRRIRDDSEFAERYYEIKGKWADKVEHRLVEKALDGHFKSQREYLRAHAKDRGYGKREQHIKKERIAGDSGDQEQLENEKAVVNALLEIASGYEDDDLKELKEEIDSESDE